MNPPTSLSMQPEYSKHRKSVLQLVMFLFVGWSLVFMERAPARAEEIAAVASKVSEDYVRTKLPDGTFQTESYAFGKGGYWNGAAHDPTIDNMDFMDIARTIADPLKRQSYIPSTDPNSTKLLIMIYWGKTQAPQAENQTPTFQYVGNAAATLQIVTREVEMHAIPRDMLAVAREDLASALKAMNSVDAVRRQSNIVNAQILGFGSSWAENPAAVAGTPFEIRLKDLLEELEENRYFVVLMAYDFQLLWKEKKAKLLWETRFSIRERRHPFDKELAAMALSASQYFGKDSGGLIHEQLRETNIIIGQPKVLEYEPEKGK